jgi:uncharacterized ion transporter superfamily protein YfcC
VHSKVYKTDYPHFVSIKQKGGKMPKPKSRTQKSLGAWAFLVGVILAVVLGLFSEQIGSEAWLVILLVVLGIIIGLLNITGREAMKFLLIGTALVLVSSLGGEVLFGVAIIGPILAYLTALFTPATIVVAIKAAFALAKD